MRSVEIKPIVITTLPMLVVLTMMFGLAPLLTGQTREGMSAKVGGGAPVSSEVVAAMPLLFERNGGQFPDDYDFVVRNAGLRIGISASGITFGRGPNDTAAPLHIGWESANANAQPEGLLPADTQTFYIAPGQANGVEATRRKADNFSRVGYEEIRPGVGVVFYGNQNRLEYDLRVANGRVVDNLRIRIQGADATRLDDEGNLIIERQGRQVIQRKPRVFQQKDDQMVEVASAYIRHGDGAIGFALEGYDHAAPLVIDPIVEFATAFGGDDALQLYASTVDAQGNLYLMGNSAASVLPGEAQPPTRLPQSTGGSMFVTKISADWSRVIYTTYISWAPNYASKGSLAVASDGDVYFSYQAYGEVSLSLPIIGNWGSSGMPSSWIRTLVGKLAADGGSLRWHTAIGCTGGVFADRLVVDKHSRVILAGISTCLDFPVTSGAYTWGPSEAGSAALVVVSLEPDGKSARYALQVGGTGNRQLEALAITAQDEVVLGGMVSGTIPTLANSFQSVQKGSGDAFFLRFSGDGTQLLAATRYGGSELDRVYAMAVDEAGHVVAALNSTSADLAGVENGFESVRAYNSGALVRLNAAMSAVEWATYYPGLNAVSDVYLDAAGNVWFLGSGDTIGGSGLPITVNRLMPGDGWAQGYLGRLTPDGRTVALGTAIPGWNVLEATLRFAGAPGGVTKVVGPTFWNTVFPESPGSSLTSWKSDSARSGVYLMRLNLQNPTFCEYEVSPAKQEVGWKGGLVEFSVTTQDGCPWRAQWEGSGGDAYTLLKSGGIGSGKVVVDVPRNESSYGSVGRSLRLFGQSVEILSTAASCDEPTLSPTVLAFDAAGGARSTTFSIPYGCPWQVEMGDPWYATNLQSMQGTGPVSIAVSVARNDFEARASTLKINGVVLPVQQGGGGCSANVSVSTPQLPSAGGSSKIEVNTSAPNCTWQAVATSRVTLGTGSSSTGSGSFTASVPANPTNIALTETVTVAGKSLTLTQAAGNCVATLSGSSTIVGGQESRVGFGVEASGDACAWYARIDVPWITAESYSGSEGTGYFYGRVAANTTGALRTGTITVLGKTYTVTQQAEDTVVVRFEGPKGLTFYMNGTARQFPYAEVVAPGTHIALLMPEREYVSTDHKLYLYERWSVGDSLSTSFTVPVDGATVYLIGESYVGVRAKVQGNARGDGSRVMIASNTALNRLLREWQYYDAVPLHSQYYGVVTFTAIPGPGSRFVRWIRDDQSVTVSNPASIPLYSGIAITAEFALLNEAAPLDPDAKVTPASLSFQATVGVAEQLSASAVVQRTGDREVSFREGILQCLGNPALPFAVTYDTLTTPFEVSALIETTRIAGLASGQYEDCSLVLHPAGEKQGALVIPLILTIAESQSEPHIQYPVDAASYRASPLAIGSIASVFGTKLADAAEGADALPLPTELRGAQLFLRRDGQLTPCPLFFVSAAQINFLIPEEYPAGEASLVFYRDGMERNSVSVTLVNARPSLFTANSSGEGPAVGIYLHVDGGMQRSGNLVECPSSGGCEAVAIGTPDSASGDTYLTLYGTGLRYASAVVLADIGGVSAEVSYSGAQGSFIGLDQVNIRVPKSVLGTGLQQVRIRIGDRASNLVTVRF